MRARQRKRPKNRYYSRNIKKTKNVRNSIWNDRNQIAIEKLECLNEAYRKHKSRGEENAWKLTPKDSCEVYRNRMKRNVEAYDNQQSNPREPRSAKKVPRIVKKGPNNKKRRPKRKRSISSSSIPSCTSYTSMSMSTSSASEDTNMDYD